MITKTTTTASDIANPIMIDLAALQGVLGGSGTTINQQGVRDAIKNFGDQAANGRWAETPAPGH